MRKYSREELITLREFFVNLSVAWIAGGSIAPTFSSIDNYKKLLYTLVGLGGGYILLNLSLEISRSFKRKNG